MNLQDRLRMLGASHDCDALMREAADEIDRLREHAIVLAETTRQVERERCAMLCETYANNHAKDDDDSKARAWMMLQCAARIRHS
jgi:hypothetical protein